MRQLVGYINQLSIALFSQVIRNAELAAENRVLRIKLEQLESFGSVTWHSV